MTRRPSISVCVILLATLGCGATRHSEYAVENAGFSSAESEPESLADVTSDERFETALSVDPATIAPDAAGDASENAAADAAEGASEDVTEDAAKDAVPRRLIYRATVELKVDNFDPLPDRLDEVVRSHRGFISASCISGSPGSPRTGRWTVRVPVAQYGDFLTAVRGLGEVHSVETKSDDVTAEFYDVEARIRNKRQEETRLLKLLADATGKLDEVLAVEQALSRVRGEIEQTQGRLRLLRDVTELTTVTIDVAEVRNYTPDEAPLYTTRVLRAWHNSTEAFVSTMQNLSLAAIALAPWTPLLIVLALIGWAVRRIRRRRA